MGEVHQGNSETWPRWGEREGPGGPRLLRGVEQDKRPNHGEGNRGRYKAGTQLWTPRPALLALGWERQSGVLGLSLSLANAGDLGRAGPQVHGRMSARAHTSAHTCAPSPALEPLADEVHGSCAHVLGHGALHGPEIALLDNVVKGGQGFGRRAVHIGGDEVHQPVVCPLPPLHLLPAGKGGQKVGQVGSLSQGLGAGGADVLSRQPSVRTEAGGPQESQSRPWLSPSPRGLPCCSPLTASHAAWSPLRETSPSPHPQGRPRPHSRPGLLPTIHPLGLLFIQHEPVLVAEFGHLLALVIHSLHGWVVGDDVFEGLPLGDIQSLTLTPSSSRRLSPHLLGMNIYPSLIQPQD